LSEIVEIRLVTNQHDNNFTFTELFFVINKWNTDLFIPILEIVERFGISEIVCEEGSRCAFVEGFHEGSKKMSKESTCTVTVRQCPRFGT